MFANFVNISSPVYTHLETVWDGYKILIIVHISLILCSSQISVYRFIKSQYAGKRAAPGSHSSRAQIETRYSADKSDVGVKSSALSDTSEAPSLGILII